MTEAKIFYLKENQRTTQNDKPLITIVGVLGKQGRSAANTLLKSGLYRVRGITRRVDSSEALSLVEQGVELVSLPLDVGIKKTSLTHSMVPKVFL